MPEFGERYENTVASPSNPLRFGQFVRVVTIPRGRTNAGRWWELTDGNGEFWLTNPEHCRPALIDGSQDSGGADQAAGAIRPTAGPAGVHNDGSVCDS